MLQQAEFWVALGFVAFIGLLAYVGVHRMLIKALDDRAIRIKAELDEARKLKDDAARLLADYQRKRGEAESEAQDIIAGAKAEAERLAIEAKTKIEQAEAQAAADVRGAAAEAAIAAAAKVLGQETKGKLAGELIARGIEDVRKKLN